MGICEGIFMVVDPRSICEGIFMVGVLRGCFYGSRYSWVFVRVSLW